MIKVIKISRVDLSQIGLDNDFFCLYYVLLIMIFLLEGFCWTRTAERQASRLRISYLKAVLRQDVGYFDLHVASTADVIASVSSDSLVIQECISEKVSLIFRNILLTEFFR